MTETPGPVANTDPDDFDRPVPEEPGNEDPGSDGDGGEPVVLDDEDPSSDG